MSDEIKILNDREHVLKRSGMYVGSTSIEKRTFWVPSKDKMVQEEIEYVPALYKIVNEVIDNAIDEHIRGFAKNIWVSFDSDNGSYSVRDDGRGIPVQKHKEAQKWTPEVVFTHLKAGSNFEDAGEARNTVGMNGVGASLTAIFSKKFWVEIKQKGKVYLQTFRDNNSDIDEPVIKRKKLDWTGTKVSFIPDPNFFPKALDPKLIYVRCLELSYAFPTVNIHLEIDGKRKTFTGRQFKDFVSMFGDDYNVVEDKKNGIRLGIMMSKGEGFEQYSNVNGANTFNGGTHVDVVKDIFVSKFKDLIKKKYKMDVSNYDVNKNLRILLFQNVASPEFDSQTKEKLCNDRKSMEAQINEVLGPRKITTVAKSLDGLVDSIYKTFADRNEAKDMAEVRKMMRQAKSKKISKLIDCSNKRRDKCTLYITEGDSAVSGLTAVRDPKTQAGIPLRGKVLNVNGMTPKKVIENKEIQTLMSVIGLEFGKKAVTKTTDRVILNGIRYGNISILTDADYDGYAIRCLLINFFYHYWPELFEHGIVTVSEAPIYECEKGKVKKYYYDRELYEKEMKNKKGWTTSYFKGLGSADDECWDYFINESPNMYKVSVDDASKAKLEMVFGDDTDGRKDWLR